MVSGADFLDRLVSLALEEDVGSGDVTTEALIDPAFVGSGVIVAREPLVVSGTEPALRVFAAVDPTIRCSVRIEDGEAAQAGDPVIDVDGPLRGILTAERSALNFLQRLCGIATQTRRWVDELDGTGTRVLDTRKTTPGFRALEKAAVAHGGGTNHRLGLHDAVLIKDNHLARVGSVREAVTRARAHAPQGMKIEVEVEDLEGLDQAIAAGADVVLLDNMSDEQLTRAVERAAGRVTLEASGGITLDRLATLATIGVDFVSVGALTHSVAASDLALDVSSTVR